MNANVVLIAGISALTALGGVIGGYLVAQPATIQPQLTHPHVSEDRNEPEDSIIALMETNDKVLDRLSTARKISAGVLNPKAPSDVAPCPSAVAIPTAAYEDAHQHISSTTYFDEEMVRIALSDIVEGDTDDRLESLLALSWLGNDHALMEIDRIIVDENEDTALRAELIEHVDWHDRIDQLRNLLSRNHDSAVRAAAMSVAAHTQLEDAERSSFESAIVDYFEEDSNDFSRIAALSYFSDRADWQQLDNLLVLLEQETDVSPHLREVIDFFCRVIEGRCLH